MNLEYAYDLLGNVEWIKDWKAGSPQLQDFGYDSLNRLVTASATGGSGGTYAQENYLYATESGLLTSKAGMTLRYDDPCHPHTVTSAGTTGYGYDANGNQTVRDPSGAPNYYLTFDAENRLVAATGPAAATFLYDGDGRRVKGTVGTTTTTYLGDYFEFTGSLSTMKKNYYAGSTRVAERKGTSTVYYLLGDHLGSTSITASSSGGKLAEVRYKPWGEDRYTWGTSQTTFRYTGQRQESGIGLYFYNARWYDPSLSRFVSADTLVPQPGNVLAWDRYSYSLNNPVRYTDPSGHMAWEGGGGGGCGLITCSIIYNKSASTGGDTSSSNYKSEEIDPCFDTTLGGKNYVPKEIREYQEKRPSVYALIAIGVPLTLAIVLFEAGLTYAEIHIALATLAQPEIAAFTVPLELVLSGTSLALIDLDVAYWSYTYRIAFSPESVTVDFEILPPWGFGQ